MTEVTIVDSSPRDGPVALPKILTSEKVSLANSLIQSGVAKIDCVAFTHPRIRPEYADAEQVVNSIQRRSEVHIIGLAPNEIACRRALTTAVDEIGTLIAASDSFNRSVLGIGIRETLYKTFPAIIQASRENGKSIRTYILTAFGCQYEGKVLIKDIVDLASKLTFMGVNEITLVDTPGMANPKLVKETLDALGGLNLKSTLAVHFHNTRGMGLINCATAFDAGIRTFDTAIGGLSGTPFGAPRMGVGSWNVPTEDLVYMFHQMGIDTGVDLEAIVDSVKLAQQLAGQDLSGHVLKAETAFKRSNYPDPLKLN